MKKIKVNRKDYFIISFIGFSFGIFLVPILKNLNLPFLALSNALYLSIILFFMFFAVVALWIASIIGKRLPVVLQFAKFAAVGAFNTTLDWGLMNVLIFTTGLVSGYYYSIFKGCSFLIATIGSFFWNKYWAFAKKEEANTKEVGSFIAVSLVGLIINISLASIIVFIFGSDDVESAKRMANIGAALATVVSLIWNFIGYKFLVFKK